MPNIVSRALPNQPLTDNQGNLTFPWAKWFNGVGRTVNGFDQNGAYQGAIGRLASIFGKTAPLATLIQHLLDSGVIEPAGLPAATDAEQGAVILPAGATSNTLGSAAMHAAGDFDPSGSAAAAQTAASAHADTVAGTAQSNAETFATSSIAAAFAPGLTVSITTAALTVGGTQGSMDFTNGLLTAQTPAT